MCNGFRMSTRHVPGRLEDARGHMEVLGSASHLELSVLGRFGRFSTNDDVVSRSGGARKRAGLPIV